MQKFEEIEPIDGLLKNLRQMGFLSPTEVQSKTIPIVMDRKDIVVRSKTGSGKTGAFLIPIINNSIGKKGITSLIITPTRELAIQVQGVAQEMSRGLGLYSTVVYGGVSIENQIRKIRNGANIIVGTPGRLIDLMRRKVLSFRNLEYLVLDEADTMLDMGFIENIEYIISQTPERKQVMLFSATIPSRILGLSKKYMKEPEYIRIGQEKDVTVSSIFNTFAVNYNGNKVSTLLAYMDEYSPRKAIIFTEQKRDAATLYEILVDKGHNPVVIHGDLTQAQREKALSEFRNGSRFLVATNVASRGLDISNITDVINFDAPREPEVYVHRVGRSARMGKEGKAFTIIDQGEEDVIENIEDSLKIRMSVLRVNEEAYSSVRPIYRSSHSSRGNYGRRDFGSRRRFSGNNRSYGRGHRSNYTRGN
jgi:ATP-dependent RNA helicase DeaD